MSAKSPSAAAVLVPLAKVVIEAALEAELLEHLAGQTGRLGATPRRNSRNGTRPKTVRTAVGPITVEVPRDRWGTFQPVTVGKWQRETVSIDRLLLLLAASGVPTSYVDSMLAQAYPAETARRTLSLIGETVQAHLRPWHARRLQGPFPVLRVHWHAGAGPGLCVVSVVGTRAPDARGEQERELLSLRAVTSTDTRHAFREVARDLHRRQLGGVRWVVGAAAAPFREAAAGIWQLDEPAPLSA